MDIEQVAAPEFIHCANTGHDGGLAYSYHHQSDGSSYERCDLCGHIKNYRSTRFNALRRRWYWSLRRVVGHELANRLTA